MPMPKLDYDPKLEYQNRKDRERVKAVNVDVTRIDSVVTSHNIEEIITLHRDLDGKYQSCIANWGQSMYGFFEEFGFKYELLSEDSLVHNLLTMRPKLQAFMLAWNNSPKTARTPSNASDVKVTVNNTVNISVSFDEARQIIEDMTALNKPQTDEIIEKIDELELIQKESSSRKTKWEKVKPIILFVMDKGADVATAILALIVQMKLGI